MFTTIAPEPARPPMPRPPRLELEPVALPAPDLNERAPPVRWGCARLVVAAVLVLVLAVLVLVYVSR